MVEQALLDAISTLIDEKLEPINNQLNTINDRISILEIKSDMTHKKLNDLDFSMKSLERDLKRDNHLLKDGQETLIAVLEAKGSMREV